MFNSQCRKSLCSLRIGHVSTHQSEGKPMLISEKQTPSPELPSCTIFLHHGPRPLPHLQSTPAADFLPPAHPFQARQHSNRKPRFHHRRRSGIGRAIALSLANSHLSPADINVEGLEEMKRPWSSNSTVSMSRYRSARSDTKANSILSLRIC
jgi:hypothetical protein